MTSILVKEEIFPVIWEDGIRKIEV
jgi:hypothetical protein